MGWAIMKMSMGSMHSQGETMQRSEIRLVAVFILAGVCLGCGAGSSAFHDGYKAELRKDYDTALIDYEKAVKEDPENSQFLIHEKLVRTEASLYHLNQGKKLLASGRPEEASG
jgi:hypothetical protein